MEENAHHNQKTPLPPENAQRQLQISEERYRAIVEDQTELICRWKPGRILTFVNGAYCRSFGKRPEQLLGRDFLTLIPSEDRDTVTRHLRTLGADNPILTHEHRVVLPSGQIRWQEWTNRAIFDHRGRITEFQSVGRDITERKKNEMALRMSEQCFKAVADYTWFWEIWISPDGKPLWTNPAVKRITGYNVKEILAMTDYPAPLIYKPDRDKARRAFQSAIKGTTGQSEFRIRKKTGQIIWTEIYWQPIYDDKGSPLGHRASIRDITERKQAQQALQMSEKRFRQLTLNVADWIWEVDQNARYTYCSPRVTDVLGYTPEQTLSKTPFDFMPPDEAERIRTLFKEIAQKRSDIVNLENWNIAADGRKVCLLTNAVPIIDTEGKFAGYRGVDKDITKNKLAQQTLKERNRQLELTLDSTSKQLRKPSVELDEIGRDLQQYYKLVTNQIVAREDLPQLQNDAADALKAGIPRTIESLRDAAANIAQILNSLTPSGESKQNS